MAEEQLYNTLTLLSELGAVGAHSTPIRSSGGVTSHPADPETSDDSGARDVTTGSSSDDVTAASADVTALTEPSPGSSGSSSESDGRTPGGGKARTKRGTMKRTVYTRRQLSMFEGRFRQKSYPDKQEVQELVAEMGLTEKQIRTWFQNRRCRLRRQGVGDAAYTDYKIVELMNHRVSARPQPFRKGLQQHAGLDRYHQQELDNYRRHQASQAYPAQQAAVTSQDPPAHLQHRAGSAAGYSHQQYSPPQQQQAALYPAGYGQMTSPPPQQLYPQQQQQLYHYPDMGLQQWYYQRQQQEQQHMYLYQQQQQQQYHHPINSYQHYPQQTASSCV